VRPASLDDGLLHELAERHGTPLYVYDGQTVRARVARLATAFDRVRFAQKANSCLPLLRLVRATGAGIDAVSAGEVRLALRAGFRPHEILFTADLFEPESLALVRAQRLPVNLGSADMLDALADGGTHESVWLRVNPGFGHGHDEKVKTGGAWSKHGIWHEELPRVVERVRARGLAVRGLHAHIGSGCDLESLARASAALRDAARHVGSELRVISSGGGLPVPYRPEDQPFDLDSYAAAWRTAREAIAADLGHALELEVEPGRFVVAEAGVLVTRVCGRKRSGAVDWVLVDAGFNDLVRPAFYGAYHAIEALGRPGAPRAPRAVAGPLCESADVFTRDADGRVAPRDLPDVRPGDLLCICDAGAYGASMASGYNARPLAAEVLLDRGRRVLARRGRPLEDTLEQEA